MPILTVKDWDPTGTFTATEQKPSKTDDAMAILTQLVKAAKTYSEKRATNNRNNQYRTAAQEAMGNPTNQTSYDYDPKTGSYSASVKPKDSSSESSMQNAMIRRQIFRNQFGYDPITGEKVQDPKKPAFGYSNDILAQILGGGMMNDEDPNTVSGAPAVAPVANPQLQIPSQSGGQTGFLSPQEHYNQLRASGYSVDEARKLSGV